jgi:predicted SAM-dependent methyltransferase
VKLEIGCGKRPTPGYVHNDVNAFEGVDQVCPAWETTGTYAEVMALGVIEHLTYADATRTIDHVRSLLEPGGVFYFDVPDFAAWSSYLLDGNPWFDLDHIQATLHGWCRWPGDEHKSSWTLAMLDQTLADWSRVDYGLETFLTPMRDRMLRPGDAHIYVAATK